MLPFRSSLWKVRHKAFLFCRGREEKDQNSLPCLCGLWTNSLRVTVYLVTLPHWQDLGSLCVDQSRLKLGDQPASASHGWN